MSVLRDPNLCGCALLRRKKCTSKGGTKIVKKSIGQRTWRGAIEKKREGRAPLGLIQKNSVLRALVMTSMSTLLPMTRIARISSVATGQTIMLSLLS